MSKEIKKKIFIYIFILLLIEGFLITYFYYQKNKEESSYFQNRITQSTIEFQSVNKSYDLISKTIFNNIINKDDILKLIKEANESDKERQNILREKLYSKLIQTYEQLKSQNIRQLHFHLPNAISFLRFHKPSKFGDSLLDVRYSIKKVNLEREYVEGFEEGRVFNGFRHVFPLFFENKFIGTVEISYSFNAIKKILMDIFPSTYMFILKREVVDKKVWYSERVNYLDTSLSDEYLYDKKVIFSQDIKKDLLNLNEINKINSLLKSKVADKLKKEVSFCELVEYKDRNILVTFLPIQNIENKNVAYYITYKDDNEFCKIEKEFFYKFYVLIIFAIIIIFLIIRKYLTDEELKFNQKYLKTIFDTQKNILIVTNKNGLIDANHAFFEFFDKYKNIGEFKKDYNSICDLFEKSDSKEYLTKEINGENWIDYILKNPTKTYKVLIKKDNKNHIFAINVNKMKSGELNRNVIVLTDITELEEYKNNLEKKVQKEVNIRREKDKLLIQQSKMAAMGEMIGAITHQWKQPLNILSLVAQGLEFQYEKNMLTKDTIDRVVSRLLKQINFMAKTVDDFKNFFTPNKEKIEFNIKDAIEDIFSILKFELKKYNIIYSIDNGEISAFGFPNEFKQVILNIINNSKDAIIKKQKSDIYFQGKINVKISKEKVKSIIKISDNAGGIEMSVIDKIFEPYFTTKSSGTGIGLYMSKIIIEDSINGKISVKNIINEDKSHGAEFLIEII